MAYAQNQILAGDYKNCLVSKILFKDELGVDLSFCGDVIHINPETIDHYELVTQENSQNICWLKGMAGAALLGPVGALAGVSGSREGIYTVAIYWKDGKKSIAELNEKNYKILVQSMF